MFIDTISELSEFCEQIIDGPVLAVDTEFVRERTYFPKLCLIQVATREVHACIDPLALPDLDPLIRVLYQPDTLKILHAGRQDLEIFYQLRSEIPVPLFDTQIASDLAGLGEQISYAVMVRDLLGINLDKAETRTNWVARPLSENQLNYAIDDVRYLIQAYDELTERLHNRHTWVLEESSVLQETQLYDLPTAKAHTRVKGASKLTGSQRHTLKALATWREEQAMAKNLPRRWVLEDRSMIAIASEPPSTPEQLAEIEGITPKIVQRYGPRLLEIVEMTNQPTAESSGARPPALSQSERDMLKAMRAAVDKVSQELNISSSRLASKKDLIQILRAARDSRLLSGWRRDLIGQRLVDMVQEG